MKIGIDARMYRQATAGIGRYTRNLIHNLLQIDHDDRFVLFMTPADRQEFKLTTDNRQLTTIVVDIPHYSLAEQTKLPAVLEKEKLDLMHFTNFNHPVCYKGKFIVTIHDLTLLFYPATARKTNVFKRWAYVYAMKKACQNSAKIIAVSESTKNDIIRAFGISESKIKVIPEAADDKSFRAPPKALLRQLKIRYSLNGEPIILYVGQDRPHKNIPGLVEAFQEVQKTISARLVLLGSQFSQYRDSPDIIRPGFVSDEELAAWYSLATVFALSSFYEGFGLPGLEAMAAGLPVVASKSSSLPEIFRQSALYFDPQDPHEMAETILEVLKDPKLQKKLIEKGKEVVKNYSWQKTAQETLKIYQEIKN